MDIEQLKKQIASNEAVMVYFSGENCGVCEVLRPKIKSMLKEKFPKVKQIFISAEEFKATAADLSIFSVPSLIIYLDGKEFIRKSRNISVLELENELKRPYSLYFE